jgi:predicted DNA binding CopG/RHH family protein
MRNIKLTRQEKAIEGALLKGEFVDVGREELAEISGAIARRRKDAVLNIRVNSQDLNNIKQKAKKLGVKYQTLISEMIHRVAIL